MITKDLEFYFSKNLHFIFKTLVDNNTNFIKHLEEIKSYEQGEWKKQIRKDNFEIVFNEVPEELKSVISFILNKNGYIPLKLKLIIIESTDNSIKAKVKVKLTNNLGTKILSKFVKFKTNITSIKLEENKTKVNAKITINSLLFKEYNDKINELINNNLDGYYINRIVDYIEKL